MNAGHGPKILSLLGPSNAGKTTLAAYLVARWHQRGLDVGYAKHASHGFHMDRPGKDTERVTRAGAPRVAVTGPEATAFLERRAGATPEALIERFFAGADVVVFEGFREAALPAVVLTGGMAPREALAVAQGDVLAVVTEAAETSGRTLPVFAPGANEDLARHLERVLALV
ncbi:MAG: molybdopterin-guanine dinucleotide biosynthesis protein B [Planctomycetota bacterium]